MRRAILFIFLMCLSTPVVADDRLATTLLGAGVGGFVGNQFGSGSGQVAATAGGAFLGGLIGNDLGRSYYSSRVYNSPAYYYNNDPILFSDPGPYYYQTYSPNYVAPPAPPPPPATVTFVDTEGSYCREYSKKIRVGGRIQESYGTACLQPDGSWRIVQ